MGDSPFEVVAAVNDHLTLHDNLLRSSLLYQGIPFHRKERYSSAGLAYTDAIREADADVLVFAHQDVYLPADWCSWLGSALSHLKHSDPSWGVLGVFGVTDSGERIGHCWSSGLGRTLGRSFGVPRPVVSVDELLIVVRRSSGLTFDKDLPGFHLYGTDIALQARRAGLGTYVIDAPVVHNSRPVRSLRGGYTEAYRYMQRKWVDWLPVPTAVVPVTRFGAPLLIHRFRALRRAARKGRYQSANSNNHTGPDIAKRIGLE